jgi:hypothetical protein
MSLTVVDLAPVAGSTEAAQLVIEAIVDLKKHARAQAAALKTAHAEELAAVRRVGGDAGLAAAPVLLRSREPDAGGRCWCSALMATNEIRTFQPQRNSPRHYRGFISIKAAQLAVRLSRPPGVPNVLQSAERIRRRHDITLQS